MTAGPPSRPDGAGLALLVLTTMGWGLNWPAMKLLLAEWPVLATRSVSGTLGFAVLLAVALARRESLAVPVALWPRLGLVSLLNVTAWMGLASFSLLWLSAAEATIVCYTMPVWAVLMAWAVLGEKPGPARILGLGLALSGLVLLVLGRGVAVGLEKAPGVAFGLGSAILFSLGTVVTKRWPLGLPPTCATVWQVGLGILPLVLLSVAFDEPDTGRLGALEWGLLAYGGVFALGLCYLSWFAALRRLPASLASLGTLITPMVGVASAALFLGEPFGWREATAMGLTLSGVGLAIRG
ncbi:DMT family transporter [Roseomonas terrae]|jgi:drug/metabolite transporter (DMT)-like permease|uniref:DMT family transporter n=1 Tax=Neoroseomonas terrae TaxID=424799 RepID=A0ABS5EJD4_9PROT|nr:DMT family transporter [Neoroseomonas terrae]MBR0651139.1 DMT family transporter [Neoroseomonas terrae]